MNVLITAGKKQLLKCEYYMMLLFWYICKVDEPFTR